MRRASVWVCPSCGQKITLLITPSVAPVCSRHIGGGKIMKEAEK